MVAGNACCGRKSRTYGDVPMFESTKTLEVSAPVRKVTEIGPQEMARVVGGDGHVEWFRIPAERQEKLRAETRLAQCTQ